MNDFNHKGKINNKPVAWMWKMHGWIVTAHGKHRGIKTFIDLCQPPTSTQENEDFISLIPLFEEQDIMKEINDLLFYMSDDEKIAAIRFNETIEDDHSYDLPKSMMKTLTKFGLVRHRGGGYYEQTDLMLRAKPALNNWYSSQKL